MTTCADILLVLFLAILVLSRIFLILVQVEGRSMYPTFNHGDWVVAIRSWPRRWLRRGQIVVWRLPPESYPAGVPETVKAPLYIKRVVGLPGDIIRSRYSVRIPSQFGPMLAHDDEGVPTWHVPADTCFVKGDSEGMDSIVLGPIAIRSVKGIVLTRLPRRPVWESEERT